MSISNNNPKQVNKVINLDYLELSFFYELPTFSVMPKEFNINKNIRLEYVNDFKSQNFNIVANLLINDRLIGQLKYSPSNSFLSENTCHLKIENHHLYSANFFEYIDYLITEGFTFNSIVRIDIAIDTIKHNLLDFMKKYQQSELILCKGRAKDITTKLIGKTYKTVYFGSTQSSKFIKIYNKSVELSNNTKPYINYFYKVNGLDYVNNIVERLELTLRNPHTKLIDLNRLTDSSYLASICHTQFKNFYQFESNYIQHNKRMKKDCTPIHVNDFSPIILPKFKAVNKHTTLPIKQEIKRLYKHYLSEIELYKQPQKLNPNNEDSILVSTQIHIVNAKEVINRICQRHNLNEYLEKNKEHWKKEFLKNNSI